MEGTKRETGDGAEAGRVDDGGSAFPEIFTDHKWSDKHSDYMQDTYSAGGMTLRDWFAGQALAGYMSLAAHPGAPDDTTLARYCYTAADAMIQARKVRG